MKIILLTILFSAWINAGFTQSMESIKVPDFTDPEVKTLVQSYHAQRDDYLKAVRQNNKQAIKTAFEKDVASTDKITNMIAKTKASGAAEHGKLLKYIENLIPFTNEINQSSYVKELTKEYLKNYEKNKKQL